MKGGSADAEAPRALGASPLRPVAGFSLYAHGPRVRRDVAWTFVYCGLMALVFFGSFDVLHRGSRASHDAQLHTPEFYTFSLSCDAEAFDVAFRTYDPAYGARRDDAADPSGARLLRALSIWIPVTALLGIPASIAYVVAFKKHPLPMVRGSLLALLVYSGAWTLVWFVAGAIGMAIVQLIVTALLGLSLVMMRHHFRLCADLLGLASHALSENVSIVPATLAAKLVGLGAVVYVLIAAVCASFIGKPGPNGDVFSRQALSSSSAAADVGECYAADGVRVECCTWHEEGWPAAYIVFCSLAIPWTMLLVMQIKLQIIADLVSQWYFLPAAGSSASSSSAAPCGGSATAAPCLGRAVRNALTSGFGTAAFAAAVLLALEAARSAARRAARNNLVCALFCTCVVQPLLALAEQLTRFASIAATITNQGLWPAGCQITSILKKNLLQTVSVWWVPNMVVRITALGVSACWAAIPFAVTALATQPTDYTVAGLTALVSFVIMLAIMSVMAGVLLDIVDTIYICFALDRDAQVVTRPELHAVYTEVAQHTGVVFENPDGGLQYGQGGAPPGAAPGAPPPGVQMQAYGSSPAYHHAPMPDTYPLLGGAAPPAYGGAYAPQQYPVVSTSYPAAPYMNPGSSSAPYKG